MSFEIRIFSIDVAMIPCPGSTKHADNTKTRAGARWQHCPPALADRHHKAWLTRPGALTDGLRGLGQVQLDVLGESVVVPAVDEQRALHIDAAQIKPTQAARVREVCMSIDGVPCVVARSVLTVRGYAGAWQTIRRLGQRPLADLLYHDARVARTPFEMARLGRAHPLAAVARRHLQALDPEPSASFFQTLWARRSVFWRQSQPLLVSECFLPAFWQIVESVAKHHTPACG